MLEKSQKHPIKSVPRYLCYTFQQSLIKTHIHICERSAMEIDKREHYQDISIDTLSFLHKKKVEQGKRIFYGDL